MREIDFGSYDGETNETSISSEEAMLIEYETRHSSGARLWDLTKYGAEDERLILGKLLATFDGVGSAEDARRQRRIAKIVEKTRRNLTKENGEIPGNHWAAKIHGAYLMSDVISRALPGSFERNRRFILFTETKMNSSERTLLEEMLFIDVETMSQLQVSDRTEAFIIILDEVEDIMLDKASYFDDFAVEQQPYPKPTTASNQQLSLPLMYN